MKRLRKLINSVRRAKGGFTLLELVVVLAIMGFLVAMIAPRLAGVVTGAQRNVDDTNINRLLQATSQFQERTGRLPAEMTSLVVQTGPDEFQVPNISNNNPDDGIEVLSRELADVLPLHLHILNQAEVDALRQLGITEVRNLNPSTLMHERYLGIQAAAPSLQRVPVEVGTAVLMIGAGHGEVDWSHSLNMERQILHPEFAYRIVLGYGQDSELVTAGQLQGAAISPQGRQTEDYLFNNYLLVLPRLRATADRILPLETVTASNAAGQQESFDIAAPQESFALAVLSPEGSTFPPSAVWTID